MSAGSKYSIRTYDLTKRFPMDERLMGLLPSKVLAPPAVDAVNISIQQGELFGLLGPNGAGKTTLVKMLTTLVAPTSGTASVCGHDLKNEEAIKASIGLVTTDERSFFWRLSGRQNLNFFGKLHVLADLEDRLEEVLSLVGLESAADRSFKEYSTGMRQRLAIARALLHRPQIMFLDEPTRGLDPPAIRSLHTLIRDELTSSQGMTVLMTTHWLHEAESVCDRMAILHQGRVRGLGTVTELRAMIGESSRYRIRVSNMRHDSIHWPEGVNAAQDGSFTLQADSGVLARTIDAVRADGGTIEAVQREETPLEVIFDRLLQEAAAPQNAGILPEEGTAAESTSQRKAPSFRRVAAAFLRRDWESEKSYRLAFMMSFGGIFFSAAVFFFIAQLIDETAAPYIGDYGGSYFAFVLIGIALQRYFSVGLYGFANAFRSAQTTGTLEAMLATPARLWQIVVSSSLWSYGLVSLQVVLYLIIGAMFLGVDLNADLPAVLLAALLAVGAFAALGVLSASFIMVLKRGDPVSVAVGAISTFFGGVYFPVDLLPAWLKPISSLIPMTYGLRALRLSLLQGAGIREIRSDLIALGAFALILLPVGLLTFRSAVRRAKVDGSLTHY